MKDIQELFGLGPHPLDILHGFKQLIDLPGDRQSEISGCVLMDDAIIITCGKFKVQPFTVFSGLCILGDDAFIGPHNFIRGPVYIGNGSLVGPYSEVARSIIMDNTRLYHRNTVLDSVIGSNVAVGGHTGTANRRMDGKPIVVKSENGEKTTEDTFGATIDDGANIGACVVTMPGTYIPKGKTIHLLGKSDYQVSLSRIARV